MRRPNPARRFIKKVLELDNSYSNEEDVRKDLTKWTNATKAYNIINHSNLDYGFARLDAFGRIYNRVLQYVISASQARRTTIQMRTNKSTTRNALLMDVTRKWMVVTSE